MFALLAQLTNPAVDALPEYTGDSGTTGAAIMGQYIAVLITTAISLGALAVLLYFFLGAINWITAGGDSGKIEKARSRIIQAFIGFALLVFAVSILGFVGPTFFGINFLKIDFVNQLVGGNSGNNSYTEREIENLRNNQMNSDKPFTY